MLFNSYIFIFGFLPVTVCVFFALGRFSPSAARAWLMLASLYFYAGWSSDYLWLILGSILFNFTIGSGIGAARAVGRPRVTRAVLTLGVVGNLALLGYYKYADFFIANADLVLGTQWNLMHIVLPLGISFFTFTQIAYLVDASRGEVEAHEGSRTGGFINYALFVTYFPHLLAGPIIHHKAVMPQFRRAETFRPDVMMIATGLTIFTIGLAKKVLIADGFVETVGAVFHATQAPLFYDAWVGALAYTLQLYFDFSAYSDMAIGLSLIIGVRLPLNFNSPYKAANIIDFWRRWHMTLSTFLRDYLYIPLGGNRKGPKRRYVNLYLTMLLGGFWHGAGWTFIIWGALHGLYLVINHGWRAIRPGAAAVPIWQRFLFRALTFLAVVVAWVFFRAPDVASALSILSGMAGLNHFSVDGTYSLLKIDGDAAWKIAAALAIVFLLPNSQEIVGVRVIDPDGSATSGGSVLGRVASRLRWAATPASGILMGVLFFVCLLKLRQVSEFIYYQF